MRLGCGCDNGFLLCSSGLRVSDFNRVLDVPADVPCQLGGPLKRPGVSYGMDYA